MSAAAEVLAELRALRFEVRTNGDRLRLSGPVDALTPELKARVLEAKPELLQLLTSAHAPALSGLRVREVNGFTAALLPDLPVPTMLVIELPDGSRVTWGTHRGCGRADRDVGAWLALCGSDRRRTVHEVLGELGATLRAVVIEGGKP